MVINADTDEILCDAALVTMYTVEGSVVMEYRGPTFHAIHGGPFRSKNTHKAAYSSERNAGFPVAPLLILSDRAWTLVTTCLSVELARKIEFTLDFHLFRIVGYRCANPLQLSSLPRLSLPFFPSPLPLFAPLFPRGKDLQTSGTLDNPFPVFFALNVLVNLQMLPR